MTQRSIVNHRIAAWADALFRWGYVDSAAVTGAPGAFMVSAVRRRDMGAPHVAITVRELWLPGDDADGLCPTEHGCHLTAASWHAQFDSELGIVGLWDPDALSDGAGLPDTAST